MDIDGEKPGDWSGHSVSLSANGAVVAIGAVYNDGNGSDSGHVRVYLWSNTQSSWLQHGTDIDGEAAGDNFGTSVSMSYDGTVLAIGAPWNDENGSNSGHVFIYEWDDNVSNWSKRGNAIVGEAAGNESGVSVSMSNDGTVVAIGALYNNDNGIWSGHVRVYNWEVNSTSSTWSQRGEDIDGEADMNYSGWSTSLSKDGRVVVIGARGNGTNGDDSGHVRVFQWDAVENKWLKRGGDIHGEAAEDESGVSVSASYDGTVVAIGANGNDGNGSNSGHVRIFEWNITEWVKRGQDIDGETADDNSGSSVSISNNGIVVAIGAYSNEDNGTYSGHVRIFEWDDATNLWVKRGGDIDGESAYDFSGNSVSISNDGTISAIGATGNGGNGVGSGHVRIMKWTACCTDCCADSPLRFKVTKDNASITRFCVWVARMQTQNRCALPGVRETCPSTCGTCSISADSPLRFSFNFAGQRITRSCEWTARKHTHVRCDIGGMSDTCKATCGSY